MMPMMMRVRHFYAQCDTKGCSWRTKQDKREDRNSKVRRHIQAHTDDGEIGIVRIRQWDQRDKEPVW